MNTLVRNFGCNQIARLWAFLLVAFAAHQARAVSFIITTFDVPSAIVTLPSCINDVGTIVGTAVYYSAQDHFGFLRDATGNISIIKNPISTSTDASCINNSGRVVGTFGDSVWHGYVRDASGAFTTLDPPGGINTSISGISNAGQMLGLSSAGTFVRNPIGTYTNVHINVPTQGVAYGINSAGQMVGFYLDSQPQSHGWLQDGRGIIVMIDAPGATFGTQAQGINDVGQIVGTFADGPGANAEHGFLYSGGEFTTLDVTGATLGTSLTGINNAGQIVGTFGDGSGTHGFLATPAFISPGPLTIPAIANASLNQPVVSDTLALVLDTAKSISVAGGSVSVNGGNFSSGTATVRSGDKFNVQLTTAKTYATQTCATVNIGGIAGQFCATTAQFTRPDTKLMVPILLDD